MVAYYQRHISAWMDGTEGLGDGEYRVYDVVCNLIYMNDGPIVLHESGIAGRCNQHVLAFRRNFAKLIECGKLAMENGKITNRRASTELVRIQSRRRKPPADPTPTSPAPPPSSGGDHKGVRDGSKGGVKYKPLKTQDSSRIDNGKLPSSLLFSSTPRFSDSLFSLEESTEIEVFSGWSFSDFWNPYPNKVGKNEAQKSFERVCKSGRVAFDDLMAAWRRYIAKTDDRPWCNPATWLNQGRWEDQPAENGGQNGTNRSGGKPDNSAHSGVFGRIALKRAREASGT